MAAVECVAMISSRSGLRVTGRSVSSRVSRPTSARVALARLVVERVASGQDGVSSPHGAAPG